MLQASRNLRFFNKSRFFACASRNFSSSTAPIQQFSKRRSIFLSSLSTGLDPGTSRESGFGKISIGDRRGSLSHLSTRSFATATSQKIDPSSSQEASGSSENFENVASALLEDIDLDFTMRGRIDSDKFRSLLAKLKGSNLTLTTDQSILLLRCCGESMFAEKSDVRLRLLDEVWALIPSMGIKYSIAHFNALLEVWRDNDKKTSVVEFLTLLDQQSDVQPDATTYQYLLMRYCKDGNINGATTVLEEMKSKEFGINENVFNALVYCYSKNGDTEGVKNVLNAMNASNTRIGFSTYFNMALPYAERGDIDMVKQIHAEAADSDAIGFTEQDCFELAIATSVNGHSSKIPEVLDLLPRKPALLSRAHRASLRLILMGQYEDAITVSYSSHTDKSMDEDGRRDEHNAIGYMIFILMSLKPPVRVMKEFFEYLQKKKLYERPYERALYACLRHHYEAGAFEIIHLLRDRFNIKPRTSFFYPLLLDYGKSGSKTEIVEFLDRVKKEFGVRMGQWELREYVCRDSQERLEEFKDLWEKESYDGVAELEEKSPQEIFDTDLVMSEKLDIATLLRKLEQVQASNGNPKIIWKRLVLAYCQQNDAKNAIHYYDALKNAGAAVNARFIKEILNEISSVKEPSKELIKFMERLEKESGLRRRGAASVKRFEAPEPLTEMVFEEKATIDGLLHQLELVQASNGNPKVIWKRLIVAYCQKNDGKSAQRYYDELKNSGAAIQSINVDEILDAITSVNEPSEELKAFSKLLEQESGQRIRRRRERTWKRTPPQEPLPESLLEQEDVTVEQLESQVERLKADGLNYKAALRKLVNLHAENKNYFGVLKAVKELDELGAELSSSILRAVVCAAASFVGDEKSAENLDFAEKTLQTMLQSSKVKEILYLFATLANEGMIQESIYLISFLGKKGPFSAQFDMRTANSIILTIEDVVAHLSDENRKDAANSIMEAAINSGLLKPNKKRLGGLINGALDKEDYVGATNLFVNAVNKFLTTAAVQRLMVDLIQRVDAKLLQKVYDHQQKACGETDAKFRLVMALCNCGKVQQAAKVWKAVETAVPLSAVEEDFEYYNDPNTLKNLVKVCRETSSKALDWNRLYEGLFDVFRKRRDWKSAIVAWTEIENEKRVVPSADLYRLYARILRESNRPIPPEVEFLSTQGNRNLLQTGAQS